MPTKAEFHTALIEGLKRTGMSLKEAAQIFETAPGTITRWKNGHSAPAEPARQAVIDYFRNEVRRRN